MGESLEPGFTKRDIASHEQCSTADRQTENSAGEEQARQTEVNMHDSLDKNQREGCVFNSSTMYSFDKKLLCQLKLMGKAYMVVFKNGVSYSPKLAS